jgi:putative membrane protein
MYQVRHCLTGSVIVVGLFAGLAGCADSTAMQPVPNKISVTAAAVSVPDGALSDGQIVGIMSGVDQVEVAAGKHALSHASSVQVQQFAEHMVSAHTGDDAKMISVAESQGIAITESSLCKKLKSDSAAQAETLANVSGKEFDREYVAAQLKGHEDVLDLIDHKLIPGAQNATLKAALELTRATVVGHIRMAKDAQASLGT